eukprot:CCRYP_007265-RA/>CCRYP_007265-RA protein AED:0.03 eAED:0.03 QI:196/1/1/1/1/1/3/1299/470
MTTPQRRKIFPHLDGSKKESAKKTAEGGGDASYDNAKTTKETKAKRHPSARKKNDTVNGTDDIHKKHGINKNHAGFSATRHLLPLPLVFTVLMCSGLFWISSFRDMMATGKPILDTLGFLWGQVDADANFLLYTKSTAWYDDSRGWKSKQGGLSAILPVTTDANNMGGLFVRKMSGAAGLAFQSAKLWPIVFHSPPVYGKKGMVGPSWSAGHFDPLLVLGMVGDVCLSTFYLVRLEELKNGGAHTLGKAFVLAGLVEALVFALYVTSRRMREATKGKQATNSPPSAAGEEYDPLDDPNTIPSRIIARTVLIVSTLISVVSLRDLLFPGSILSFIPRDDIYLEWTGAFLHSPPPDTVESDEHGLEAPLYAGDKFVSQLMGLYLALCCMLKVTSAIGWIKGSKSMGGDLDNEDRRGVVSSKIIWKTQAFGDMLLLAMLRLFTPAAKSASLDLRWHLMFVAYEMFILFLYGFW